MDLYEVHLSIFERLDSRIKAATNDLGFCLDGKLPDGEEMGTIPGGLTQVLPHAVLWMGEDRPHPEGEALDGPANALGILSFTVLCVASSSLNCTRMRDVVRRALVGWEPTFDSGKIRNNGGLAENPVPAMLKPQRYMRELGFYLTVGAAGAPD